MKLMTSSRKLGGLDTQTEMLSTSFSKTISSNIIQTSELPTFFS